MLSQLLPAPKHQYVIHEEREAVETLPVNPVVAKGLKEIPPYPRRHNFIPIDVDDFGDGGAYPEIHVVQHPLNMGKPGCRSSNVVSIDVDEKGQIRFDAIAKVGNNKVVQCTLNDMKEKQGDKKSLELPDEKEEIETAERTRLALESLLQGKIKSSKPSSIVHSAKEVAEPTYIRYTPNADAPGNAGESNQRVIRMVEAQVDPMEPPKHKYVKVPKGPASPPVPVLHSPPRKLTVADQQAWKVPPCVSNWKNARGYIIPLDKRLAADGRNLQEVTINNKFATLTESLYVAERKASEDLRIRNQIRKQMNVHEKEDKEKDLREMAAKARMERAGVLQGLDSRSHDDINTEEIMPDADQHDLRHYKETLDDRSAPTSATTALAAAQSRQRSHSSDEEDGEEDGNSRRNAQRANDDEDDGYGRDLPRRRGHDSDSGSGSDSGSESGEERSRSVSPDQRRGQSSNDRRSNSRSRDNKNATRHSGNDSGNDRDSRDRGGRGNDNRSNRSHSGDRSRGNRADSRDRHHRPALSSSSSSRDDSHNQRQSAASASASARRDSSRDRQSQHQPQSQTQTQRPRASSEDEDKRQSEQGNESREEKLARLQREKLRIERRKDRERELRIENMKGNFRKKKIDRDEGRDVSEKIALGMLKGTGKVAGEALYDSRLFNQSAGMDSGFGADDEYSTYSKPLFDRGEASSIYRPKRDDADVYGDGDAQYAKLADTSKFQADKGFKGAEGGTRTGPRSEPVQFERPQADDPFGINDIVSSKKARREDRRE